ncbi:MAG: hypothetical protein AAB403_12460 [Planctomycetota bacterium]
MEKIGAAAQENPTRKKSQNSEEGIKKFSESGEEKSTEEQPFPERRFRGTSILPVAPKAAPNLPTP